MYRPVERHATGDYGDAKVRVIGPEEAQLWATVSAKGWSHEHPELLDSVLQTAALCAAREQSPCFLAELRPTRRCWLALYP